MLLTPEKRDFPRHSIIKTLDIFRERGLKSIIEIGCMRMGLSHPLEELHRECCIDGHSTVYWATETQDFITVDISPDSIGNASSEIIRLGLSATFTFKDGILFLKDYQKQIDLLFLDAWDADLPDSAECHLQAFQAAEKNLHDKSLVLIDDTDCVLKEGQLHFSETGMEGKGAMVIPYAQEKGWNVVFNGRQTLLSK